MSDVSKISPRNLPLQGKQKNPQVLELVIPIII